MVFYLYWFAILQEHSPWRHAVPPLVLPANVCENSSDVSTITALSQDQQMAAVQLCHYFYKLLSIINQQMTTINR